jgi:excisionase family DNA binding protein
MSDSPALPAQDLLTTKEVADYLRIKERRVYELVRQGTIPCTRVTGKWLFPRAQIDLWLAENAAGEQAVAPPLVIAGSHDPLLDWAVKESACGLALLPGGSLDGIDRFARDEAMLAGMHIFDANSGEFNVPAVRERLSGQGLVLLEWAVRQQGLVLGPGNPLGIHGVRDLARSDVRVVRRQREAGSHVLLAHLLGVEGMAATDLRFTDETARGETDLGLAILEGRAEAGLAVEVVARSLKLDFVPLMRERYDLLMRRRDYFSTPVQGLFKFARSEPFSARAAQMGGYDVTGLGTVRYNGP